MGRHFVTFYISYICNMELDSRVKRLSPGEFRSDIHREDIRKGYGELVVVYSSDERFVDDRGMNISEEALVFVDDPIVVPNMKYVFKVRIRSVRNHMLKRVVSDLMFLNPNIGTEGIKRMAEWIMRVMVHYDKEEKRYAIDRGSLIDAIELLKDSQEVVDMEIIEKNKVILYKRYSALTPSDKAHYGMEYRGMRIGKLADEIIHEAAIYASEKIHEMLKIKQRHVIEYSKEPITRYMYNRYIQDRTVRFLEDENNFRHFESDKSLEKFLLMIDMYDESKPVRYYTESLGISSSTALNYIKLIEDVE